jgi:hypothetical protein
LLKICRIAERATGNVLLKIKEPVDEAVRREREEDWDRPNGWNGTASELKQMILSGICDEMPIRLICCRSR